MSEICTPEASQNVVRPISVACSEAVEGVHIKIILENNIRFNISSLLNYIFHNTNNTFHILTRLYLNL